jgi:hypothetical protein
MVRNSRDVERKLRRHISQVIEGIGVKLTPALARNLEDQIVALFRSYSSAPASRKEQVYATGERAILRTLRTTVRPSH